MKLMRQEAEKQVLTDHMASTKERLKQDIDHTRYAGHVPNQINKIFRIGQSTNIIIMKYNFFFYLIYNL